MKSKRSGEPNFTSKRQTLRLRAFLPSGSVSTHPDHQGPSHGGVGKVQGHVAGC
jgi:hypothetical protein